MSATTPSPVSISVAASANPVCVGSSVTFTATPANGGTTPRYQWKVNGSNVTGATNVSYSFIPANGTTVACILTSNLTCVSGNPATSNIITMTVNSQQPVGISISASANAVCQGQIVTFTATPVNGGNSPIYGWTVNGDDQGVNNPVFNYTPASNDEVACFLVSNATCITGNPALSNSVFMSVNPSSPVGVSISASANPVEEGTSVTFTATPVNGGSTPQYQWKVNSANISNATNSTYSYIPANGDVITCTLTSNISCATGNPAASAPLTMTVNSLASNLNLQNLDINDSRCFNALHTITVAGSGTSFTVRSGGNVILIAGDNIVMLPYAVINAGAYLHAYITTNGQYCISPSGPSQTQAEGVNAPGQTGNFYRIYPNPTTGNFSLELTGADISLTGRVEIYSMAGERLLSSDLSGPGTFPFSLSGQPAGVYLLHIISGTKSGTTRIIKLD